MRLSRSQAILTCIATSFLLVVAISAMEMENLYAISVKGDVSFSHYAAVALFNISGLVLFFLSGSISSKIKNASRFLFGSALLIRAATFAYISYQAQTGLFDKIELGILYALNTVLVVFEIMLFFWSDEKDESKEESNELSQYMREAQDFRSAFIAVGNLLGVKMTPDLDAKTAKGYLAIFEGHLKAAKDSGRDELRRNNDALRLELSQSKAGNDSLKVELRQAKAEQATAKAEIERLKEIEGKYETFKGAINRVQDKGKYPMVVDGQGLIWSVDKETLTKKGTPGKLNGAMVK